MSRRARQRAEAIASKRMFFADPEPDDEERDPGKGEDFDPPYLGEDGEGSSTDVRRAAEWGRNV